MYKRCLVVFCTALIASAAIAGGAIDVSALIQPGLYEITSQSSLQGMGAMPAQTHQSCLTREDLKHYSRDLAEGIRHAKAERDVKVKDVSLQGNTLHATLTTTMGEMNIEVVFDDSTHYHQTVTATMMGRAMTMHATGHRVGDCTK